MMDGSEKAQRGVQQLSEGKWPERHPRLNYSRRCAEASAVQAHMKHGLPLAPGMEIGYVVMGARKWEVDPERTASEFETRNLLPVYNLILKRDAGDGTPARVYW